METRPDAGSRNEGINVCAVFERRFRSVDGNPAMWTAIRGQKTRRTRSVGFLV